jgi:hypothetical protein
MDLTCDFLKHNRGRKKKVRVEDEEESKENVLFRRETDDRMDNEGGGDAKMRNHDDGEFQGRNGAEYEPRQDADRYVDLSFSSLTTTQLMSPIGSMNQFEPLCPSSRASN